jgi:hypothetical protein
MIAEPPILDQAVAAEPRRTSAEQDSLPSTTATPGYPVGRLLRVIAGALSNLLYAACTSHFFDTPAWSDNLEMRHQQRCCDDHPLRTEWHDSLDTATFVTLWLS